jgi:hypothetical protein
LEVESLHPGVTPEMFREVTGFAVDVGAETPTTPPPTADELAALRMVDPGGVVGSEFQ